MISLLVKYFVFRDIVHVKGLKTLLQTETHRMTISNVYQFQHEFPQLIQRSQCSIPHKLIKVYSGTWEIPKLYSMLRQIRNLPCSQKIHLSQNHDSHIHGEMRAVKLLSESSSGHGKDYTKQIFHRIFHHEYQDGNLRPKILQKY